MPLPKFYYGPDRSPRPPRFRPPAHACDAHVHIYGPASRFPYAPGASPELQDATIEDIRATLGVLGLERAVITQGAVYGGDNRALLDALERGGPNFRGIVMMMPEELTEKEVARLDALGVRGVRVNLHAKDGPNAANLEEIAARIAGAGWHLEIYAFNAEAYVGLRPKLAQLPCDVVFDAMGGPVIERGVDDKWYRELLAMFRDGMMWIKLTHICRMSKAGPPYGDTAAFARALVAANPNRCVWGSDWPHATNPWPIPNDGDMLDLVADWVPDEATRNRILVDNPAELARF